MQESLTPRTRQSWGWVGIRLIRDPAKCWTKKAGKQSAVHGVPYIYDKKKIEAVPQRESALSRLRRHL